MAAILGSEQAVRERKIYSVTYCTVAPLTHEGEMSDAFLDLIEFEAPILIYPMPCAGASGPCSLYSNIALGNAEALSSLVLFQMARPGTPLIFGDAAGSTNFASGGFLEGSPEMVLQVLSGVDLVQGPGALETSGLLCLEQIVVDDEIAGLCKRIRDGVDVSDAKNQFEDVKAVGPGGHFLTRPSTLRACRSDEFYAPQLCDRNTFERWSELGRPDVYARARERVEEILATPQKNPLPDDVIGKLEGIMQRADEELN
jgi:trimethylamine--corrinoid protein Co-methyltransferase